MSRKCMIFLASLWVCAACAPPQQVTMTLPPATEAATEAAATSAPTEIPFTQTPAVVIATAPVFVPFTIHNTVENTVLRAGPGSLFPAKTALAAERELSVYGIAPGREWVFVVTPLDSTGWIFAGLLEASPQLETAPVIQPADLQMVRGRVRDINGAPVDGIQYAVIEGEGGTGSPPRIDAVTDSDGIFYAFLPLTTAGTWTVSLTGVVCTSSQMGPDCQCPSEGCGTSDPVSVTLPLPSEEILEFTWE